eukprot:TRINITY_DN2168_c0_g1_i5.p1 TRINITY_DN2168_c0_g1~~TRINITY_DN2168_c0_g1_i5.p1  ORF type:complete len:103 (+),score=20.45 TRINITY_DN2168_c0_g1_i5:66-374(+)
MCIRDRNKDDANLDRKEILFRARLQENEEIRALAGHEESRIREERLRRFRETARRTTKALKDNLNVSLPVAVTSSLVFRSYLIIPVAICATTALRQHFAQEH